VRLGRPQTGLTPRGGFATDRSYAVLSLSPLPLRMCVPICREI